MSKDEFLKIQTCVLKVNIHCDGCKHKVKKILQKIEGVYTTKIDSEQGKVTVSGNVDPNTLIKKLIKNGKHAELWVAKPNNNNNQNNLNNQFKNMQIDHGGKGGGGGGNNKGQGQKGGGNNQQKGGGGGGGGGPQGQNPQLQQHLQQLQQMKGFQDMKMLPQFMKDMKMPSNHGKEQNAKSVKFKLPEDEDLSDDDFDDDYDDDDEFDDDELDDEMDHAPLNKMKPMIGNGHGGPQMPNVMMQNMMNGQLPQHMKPAGNGGNNGGNGAGNGKKGGGGGGGGGGNIPVQIHAGGGGGGGKKGGNGNNGGGNQNQGGGAKGGKNGGGGQNSGGNGGQNKNVGGGGGGGPANGNHFMANGAKKVNDGAHGMPNMMAMNGGGNVGHMQNMPPMGQMGHHMSNHLPMGQMSNLAAVQGLPASAMSGGAGGGPGYFPGGSGPEHMQGNPNPYYQQQLAAMMMNQQRANGNERFQPMMYARPPPAVNYMPPYPPYPYPPPPGERADQYAMFSDENTSSCSVM
ncbi:Heavy metal transport/detoxification superfamily protein [Perilla frutescens var. hirtella]|uniref:Heavy metal transport/detoxification superfamily protein n=1 Tax=Perilla frutescens var. hirtella TaxID=608512 RepID=A0AAD4JFS3_PERFH|nr:Heavy metal transport/detoxification superfamily protein [Perilla frutescens var. hirtella]